MVWYNNSWTGFDCSAFVLLIQFFVCGSSCKDGFTAHLKWSTGFQIYFGRVERLCNQLDAVGFAVISDSFVWISSSLFGSFSESFEVSQVFQLTADVMMLLLLDVFHSCRLMLFELWIQCFLLKLWLII